MLRFVPQVNVKFSENFVADDLFISWYYVV